MRIEFTILSVADARQAVAMCESIAILLNTSVAQEDPIPRQTRRSAKKDLAEAYNEIAAAAGATQVQVETETVAETAVEQVAETVVETAVEQVAETVVEPKTPGMVWMDEPVATRSDKERFFRGIGVKLGVLWLREHGSVRYGKAKLADVSDDNLDEMCAAAHAANQALAS